jgi:hypothetical protein
VSEEDKVKLSDVKKFNLMFFLICASCVLNYSCLFPFLSNIQSFLGTYYGISDKIADQYMSIPYFMAAAITPFVGLLVD